MDRNKLAEILARARSQLAAQQQEAADALEAMIEQQAPSQVSFATAGISDEQLETDEGEEAAVDVIRDVIANMTSHNELLEAAEHETKQHGVSKDVKLNEKQAQALATVLAGQDCCIIGAAGTGKTTSMRQITRHLLDTPGRLSQLHESTKHLRADLPGACIVAYTRKAVNNIRHAVVEELKPHTITIHKLLEFQPIFYEIEDPADPGNFKKTMRFEPTRNIMKPLPAALTFIAYEESSMTGCDLYSLVQDACPHPHQEVFLGDIQQLPPIFGSAVLGYKMVDPLVTVVELTEVYRQALDNPILAFAWELLRGDAASFADTSENYETANARGQLVTRKRWPVLEAHSKQQLGPDGEVLGELKLQPWQKKIDAENALNTCGQQFIAWAESGYYRPDDDMILMPFNKAFGTIELNKKISQHLGRKREAVVHEVIAGFNKYYLAVGDRVLYDKEDAFITAISRNVEYLGKAPMPASTHLDRWGVLREQLSAAELAAAQAEDAELSDAALEAMMAVAAGSDERVTASSHDVVIRFAYSEGNSDGDEVLLSKATEINNLLGGYALTVHKAQGSEWERGFFIMHNSHAVMNQRELLYTAPTRFKRFLHIICEPDTLKKGIKSQRIEGNTIAEKAAFFQGKHEAGKNEALQSEKQGGEFLAPAPPKQTRWLLYHAESENLFEVHSPEEAYSSMDMPNCCEDVTGLEAYEMRYSQANATGRNEQRREDEGVTSDVVEFDDNSRTAGVATLADGDSLGAADSLPPASVFNSKTTKQEDGEATARIEAMRERLRAIRASKGSK